MTNYIDTIMVVRSRAYDALERLRPQMATLQVAELEPIKLEPIVSASIVRGALPGLLALFAQMTTYPNDFDISNLDLLETYALALLAAEGAYRAVSAKPERSEEAKQEGLKVRAQLVAHCSVLAQTSREYLHDVNERSVRLNEFPSLGPSARTLRLSDWIADDGRGSSFYRPAHPCSSNPRHFGVSLARSTIWPRSMPSPFRGELVPQKLNDEHSPSIDASTIASVTATPQAKSLDSSRMKNSNQKPRNR